MALLVAGVAALPGALATPSPASAAPVAAQPASTFRDSIGVQTHFSFTGYAYDTSSTDDLAAKLRALGVAHIRDDVCFLTDAQCARVRARIGAMQDALGPGEPKVDLVAMYTRELAASPDRADRDADITRALTAASQPPLAGMLAGLEPVNEPDLKDTTDWARATLADDATYRRLLAQRQFTDLRGVLHLSPSIGHAANTPTLLRSGWTRAQADIGNFHPYPPAWGGPENALDTPCGATEAYECALELGGAAEPWATESGYTTSGSQISTSWVSERAQAIYLPRLLLENFRRGVARTYLYELIDLKPSTGSAVEGYGLWRSRYAGTTIAPGSAKPAAEAISRMNETIGDLGAGSAAQASLDVSVASKGRELGDDDVRRVLLRRADGSYVLALWQPKTVWQNKAFGQQDLQVDDVPVDVTIGGGPWNATATRPTQGDDTTGTWTNAQRVSLPVGADVTLIDLHRVGGDDPGTSTPPPATTPPQTGPSAAQAAAIKAAWDYLSKLLAAALAAQIAQSLR